ncbi:MAG: YncE family protein [candidate division WOR-3 bacterium]
MSKRLFPIWACCVLLVLLIAGCQRGQPRIPIVLAEIPLSPGHPVKVATNSRTGYVYITSEYVDYVYVLRGLEHVATLRTEGDEADALAVDEERGWVYVVNKGSDSVTVIRGTEVITTMEVEGREPLDVVVEPRRGWAYVVSGYRKLPPRGERPVVEGNLTVISGTMPIGVVPLGDVLATRAVVDPLSGYVYVGCVGGDVIVIDGMEEIARFGVEAGVLAMDVDPRTGDVYILDGNANLVRVQNTEIIQQANLWREGPSPRNMRVHPVSGDVYIVYGGSWMLVVRDMEVIGNLEVGWGALKMAIDPLTGNVYAANFRDDTVAVVHGAEVLETIRVGWYPYGIGVNPANGWVYVSNANGDSVTVLGFEDEE